MKYLIGIWGKSIKVNNEKILKVFIFLKINSERHETWFKFLILSISNFIYGFIIYHQISKNWSN